MCELLGMSANVPTDICFSFTGLMQRGGNTGPHCDGWGITFYNGKGYQNFKDPSPSCASRIAQLVQQYPIKSCAVISHIRQANRGEVSLVNTHPFTRELWGHYWTFAHNGQLTGYDTLDTGRFEPVGDTDSERAFCWLLSQLETSFPGGRPEPEKLYAKLAACCDELRQLGVYNMLLSDGFVVATYCTNNLYWITRRAPFGKASLIDEEVTIDFQQETTPNDVVTVIATQPLTNNEQWTRMLMGELCVFKHGEVVYRKDGSAHPVVPPTQK
uniref:class II glutamine amidotransferase n=1 Tax=Thaumasiovibrio occultus TaxID=1891184 RepID=UPI000B364322|nr:class II glutamine amidotransferase [Thaumasiovibrio occultus]